MIDETLATKLNAHHHEQGERELETFKREHTDLIVTRVEGGTDIAKALEAAFAKHADRTETHLIIFTDGDTNG